MRCALVYPVWVRLGSVQWQGSGQPEPLFCTERKTCGAEVAEPITSGGLTFHLCPEHRAEVEAGRLFCWEPKT